MYAWLAWSSGKRQQTCDVHTVKIGNVVAALLKVNYKIKSLIKRKDNEDDNQYATKYTAHQLDSGRTITQGLKITNGKLPTLQSHSHVVRLSSLLG